jgi:hypothetical protein
LENGIEHKMCVLIFSATFIWNIFYSKNNSTRYRHKCSKFFTQSTRYSCIILMKLEFWLQIFGKGSSIKFYQNLFIESQVAPCGRTDRQAELRS